MVSLALLTAASAAGFDDAQVDKIFKQSSTVGGAVVVTHHGRVIYEHYYGYQDKGRKAPVTADTYFRLASITKMITNIGAMQLVEAGKLSLDESIGETLGYTVINPRFDRVPVTLRHLMTHTAGLNDNGGYSVSSRTLSRLFSEKSMRNSFRNQAPGSKYTYSNFGAGVIGSLMEAASGQELNAYMTQNVFAPLGIEASYHPATLSHPEHISSLYDGGEVSVSAYTSMNRAYDLLPNPDTHFRINVGSLWIKPTDLSRLMVMLANGGQYEGTSILDAATVAEMLADQSGKPYMTAKALPYGLMVERVTSLVKGKTLYGYQGMGTAFICNAYFDKENEWTFVMLTNGCSMVRQNRIGQVSRKLFEYCYGLMEEGEHP